MSSNSLLYELLLIFSLNLIKFYHESTSTQNQIEQTERELKIRNYSPKTIIFDGKF